MRPKTNKEKKEVKENIQMAPSIVLDTGFSDAEATVDLMGIEGYTKGLADFIETCCTPMTIAIQGAWGTGKTSIMNFVYNHLKQKIINPISDEEETNNPNPDGSIIYVPFNTWQFSQFNADEQLPFSLITYLISAIEETDPKSSDNKSISSETKEKLKKIFRTLYRAGRDAAKAVLGYYTNGLSAIAEGPVLLGLDKLEKDMEGEETYSDTASAIVDLKETFQKCINNALGTEKGQKRIVVFIDDLDRLNPEKAVELLEVLKLFMNCPGCVFVLAIDYDVVIRGVNAKYGQFDDNPNKGKQFFDKIIQLPFKVPTANYQIDNYVHDLLSKLEIESEDQLQRYVDLINYSVGTNPRAIKRLFNAFLLLTMIEKNVIKGEINNELLFAVICLQQVYDSLYKYFIESSKNKKQAYSKSIEEITEDINSMSLDELTEKYNTGFLDYDIDNLRAFVQTLYPLIEKEEDAAKFVVYLKVSTTTSQTDNNNDKKAVIKKVEALDGFDFAEDNIRRYATELDKFLKEIQGKTNNTKIEYEKSLSRQWISFEYESSTHKFVIVNIFLSDISSSKSNAPYMTFYGKAVKEQIEAILKSKNKDFVSSNNNVSVNISNLNFGDDEELLKQLIDVELERRSK